MNIFGSIQILWHETRLISLVLSVTVFLYFFIATKETLLIRLLSAALWMFAGLLLCEIPWMFGYYLFVGGWVLALDVVEFVLGEFFILYIFNYLRRKGLDIPSVNFEKWLIVFLFVWLSTNLLVFSGFYPLWVSYLNGEVLIDPHTIYPFNLEWSIGKAVGMLGWLWIVDRGMAK